MTTLGVILALALGISGLFYLLAALWLLLTGRAGLPPPRAPTAADPPPADRLSGQRRLAKPPAPRYPTRPVPERGRISRWAR